MQRRFVVRFGIGALACGWMLVATPGAGAAPPPSAGTPGELTLEPHLYETRSHGEVAAEFGTIRVPENRGRADSRPLELAFVRLPAEPTADAAAPPIVYLAGGPGGSGISAGRGDRFRFFDALRAVGDVILLDQRGTGASTRIQPDECPLETVYPHDRPLELDRYLALVEDNAAACARFWAESGVDLSAYSTLDSVADLEALRSALGVEQLDLLGISYGTHLALSYLRRHPERVRRAVLAGTEGPDHTVKLPSQFDDQFARLEAMTEAGRSGDLRTQVEALRAALEARPATLRITQVEGPDTTTHLVVGWREVAAVLHNLLQDPQGMVQLPALLERLTAGDFTDIAGALESQRRIGGLEAMPEAMDAASGISPRRLARLESEDATTLFGSGLLPANVAVARGLGVPDLGAAFRAPLASRVPTLFVSGSLDGRTPSANTLALLPGFSQASHIEVVHGGHGDDLLLAAPDLERAIVDFFRGVTPADRQVVLAAPDTEGLRRRQPLSPERAARYVGEYQRREREIWRLLHHRTVETLDADGEVRFANAVLQIRWDGDGFPFHPSDETTFYIDFPWFLELDFTVETDDSGRVTHLTFVNSDGSTVRMEKVH